MVIDIMKKLLGFVCIAALFIPAVIAIILYKPPHEVVVTPNDEVVKVVVNDSLSNVFEITDADDIKTLTSLVNGTAVSTVADEVLQFPCFDLVYYYSESSSVRYRVYMSAERTDEIYYTTNGINYFKGELLSGRTFMSMDCAVSLYNTSSPVLKVGTGNTVVLPSSMTWNYKNVSGSYIPVKNIITTTDTVNLDDVLHKINYSFSIQPTSLTIVMYGDTEKSYTAEEFPELTAAETQYVKLKFIAQWDTSDTSPAYGKAEYCFNALVRAKAVFTANAGTLTQGGLMELAVKNGDAKSLQCTCTPSLNFTPVFYTDGDILRAFIPTQYDTAPGEYTITVSQDNESESFIYSVVERTVKDKTYKASSVISAENITNLQLLINSQLNSSSGNLTFKGETPRFPTELQDYHTGYGHRFVVSGNETVFRHTGIDCRIYSNEPIYASLSGTVVYVGESEIFGGILILDHGMGLKTWYARVSPTVAPGQTVAQGDMIAAANESGFGDDNRMHFAISAGTSFIDPAILIDKGFSFPSFE